MTIINIMLPKLKESLKQNIDFGHWDVIPDKSINVVAMIMKQNQEHKQPP